MKAHKAEINGKYLTKNGVRVVVRSKGCTKVMLTVLPSGNEVIVSKGFELTPEIQKSENQEIVK